MPDPLDPDAPQCIQVQPGDTLPGVPKHKFKAGFDYWITGKWKFGADLIASSSQVFYGDEANLNSRLAGYAQVNLHSSYDINEHVRIYGLINNLFDARFGTFGNYFDTEAASEASLGTIRFHRPAHRRPLAAVCGLRRRDFAVLGDGFRRRPAPCDTRLRLLRMAAALVARLINPQFLSHGLHPGRARARCNCVQTALDRRNPAPKWPRAVVNVHRMVARMPQQPPRQLFSGRALPRRAGG